MRKSQRQRPQAVWIHPTHRAVHLLQRLFAGVQHLERRVVTVSAAVVQNVFSSACAP